MLRYNPRHVSSINMPIFRRTHCILTLCKRLYSIPDESRESALIRHTVQPFTESDYTRCCDNTTCPLEDGHVNVEDYNVTYILL